MSKFPAIFLLLIVALPARAQNANVDLLAGQSEWLIENGAGWRFESGALSGRTKVFDGEKADPDASVFLESRRVFGGDKTIHIDVRFETGRYLGVYMDYDPATRSGIWMATGHFLPEDEKVHYVESAYIKTVEQGHWVVRATGELDVPAGSSLSLRFERSGDDYRIWQGDRLVATYRKPGGYPCSPPPPAARRCDEAL